MFKCLKTTMNIIRNKMEGIRHITIKLLRINVKDRILKAARRGINTLCTEEQR